MKYFLIYVLLKLVYNNLNSFFEEFIETYDCEKEYGYNGLLDTMRLENTPHLENEIYLDYTGAGVYQTYQIQKMFDDLRSNIYGNTHSSSKSSKNSEKKVQRVRKRILKFFNTNDDEYSVIFTSGATGALKIVGESFPFTDDSLFLYTKENHNSVLGIRELTKNFKSIFENEVDVMLNKQINKEETSEKEEEEVFNLFAYPGESNFSGKKYSLDWINIIIERNKRRLSSYKGKWYVLLDAAALVPTVRLNLTKYPADFVSLSFYKIFGYPTGIGALIIKNSVANILKKKYFGGGTVSIAACDSRYCKFKRSIAGKFEDGSINFLGIASLNYGFDIIEKIMIDNITKHVHCLAQYIYKELINLKHGNGMKVVEVYGNHHLNNITKQGGIISFNLKKLNGDYVNHYLVMKKAAENNIHLRSGTHCNPGGMISIGFSAELVQIFGDSGFSCGDSHGIFHDKPTGTLRASLGYLTNFDDAFQFIQFIKKYYQL